MAEACPPSYDSHSYISTCPVSREGWEERALLKNCSVFPQTCKRPLEYHCLLNAFRNRSIEVCAPRTRLVQHFCPSYSLNAQRITDQYNCSMLFPDCPEHQYYSTDVLNYKGCLQEIPSRSGSTTTSTFIPKGESGQELYFLFFLLLIPLAALIGIYVWRRKGSSRATPKSANHNRLRKSDKDHEKGCCVMLRGLIGQNDVPESMVPLTSHVPESNNLETSKRTNINKSTVPVAEMTSEPSKFTPASKENPQKCKESINEEDAKGVSADECDRNQCKSDKTLLEQSKKETDSETFNNQSSQSCNSEKNSLNPLEKEPKTGKDQEKSFYCDKDNDDIQTETVNVSTSTSTCEGRESAVNEDSALESTLKKMLPTYVEDILKNLGIKASDGNEYQNLIGKQSWTPAQQKEISNILDKIDELKETQKKLLRLETEKGALEEKVNDIEKKFHEMRSETSAEIDKIRSLLKKKEREILKLKREKEEIENELRKKDEIIMKMKEEIETKDTINTQLTDDLNKRNKNDSHVVQKRIKKRHNKTL